MFLKSSRLSLISVISIFASTLSFDANAAVSDSCKIASSEQHIVSLGFPVREERLKHKNSPNILVVPYQLKDEPDYVFKEEFKQDYKEAGRIIENFSSGKVKVTFTFENPIKTQLTNSDMEIQRLNQQTAWMTDPEKSTWGLVRRLISSNDENLNFQGVDAVILEGSATTRAADINEAMSFQVNPQNPFLKSVETAEGLISNAILFDNHAQALTIAHEIMHLFGLTDLYGTYNGPGQLSLMANMTPNLLSFEKWTLGWLEDARVQCLENIPHNKILDLDLDLNLGSHLIIIPGSKGQAQIIDISEFRDSLNLSFYQLNNDARPPISLFNSSTDSYRQGIPLSNKDSLGQVVKGDKFSIVLSKLNNNLLTISLVTSENVSGQEFQTIVNASIEARGSSTPYRKPSQIGSSEKVSNNVDKITDSNSMIPQIPKLNTAKKSLTCVKGKVVKKIYSVSPKCPSGFKPRK
ncbi:MAG: hypothetical protein EBU66_19865 [Bacteroidetes bacterium]|nr:hypothetical protein [Bacteroidota bacterium]